MNPIPRPDWTSPLRTGTHLREFLSTLPEQPTREVLTALKGDHNLLKFLERHPLGRLEFSGRLPKPNWWGSYDRRSGNLVVNAVRGPETYGQGLNPGELPSVSAAGCNLIDAMQRSLYHELGHSISMLPARKPSAKSRTSYGAGGLRRSRFGGRKSQSNTSARRSLRIGLRTALRTKTRRDTIWLRPFFEWYGRNDHAGTARRRTSERNWAGAL